MNPCCHIQRRAEFERPTSRPRPTHEGGERKPSALSARSSAAPATAAPPPLGFDAPLGVAALILLNCAIFVAATVFQSNAAASLAINPAAVKWCARGSWAAAYIHIHRPPRVTSLSDRLEGE